MASDRDAATPLLAEHYATQDRQILTAAFFTGPMWIGWTRPRIVGWIEWLERWPVVGMVGGFAEGYLPLVDDYYYCESWCEVSVSRGSVGVGEWD